MFRYGFINLLGVKEKKERKEREKVSELERERKREKNIERETEKNCACFGLLDLSLNCQYDYTIFGLTHLILRTYELV